MTLSTLVFQKQQNKPINIPYFLWSLFLILDWSRAAPEDESFKNSVDLQKTAVLVLCLQPPAEKASTWKLKLILCCTSHTFGRRSWGRNQHLVRLSLDVAWERCQRPLWHHKGPCLSAKFQRKRSKNWIYSILKKKNKKQNTKRWIGLDVSLICLFQVQISAHGKLQVELKRLRTSHFLSFDTLMYMF